MLIVFYALTVFLLAFSQTVHAAAAWEAEWERTVKAAEQEGEISYYTVGEFDFLSEFEKKFPRIKVKVVQGRGNELLVRIMTERRAGKYLADVARIGNTSPYALYQAKTLQPIAAAFILPEVKDESKWWSGKHQYIDAEGKYIFVPVGSVSVNMVALQQRAGGAGGIELVLGSFERKMARQDRRHRSALRRLRPQRRAHGFLPSATGRGVFAPACLAEQVVMISRDYRQAIDWVAQRRFSILLFGNGDDILQAKAQGLPINVFDTGAWKEGGALEPGAFTVGLARPIAASQCGQEFLSTGCFRARDKWRFSATAAGQRLAARGYSQERSAPDGATQRRREVYGDMEGGMDGRRADAKSSEPGVGKECQEAINCRHRRSRKRE